MGGDWGGGGLEIGLCDWEDDGLTRGCAEGGFGIDTEISVFGFAAVIGTSLTSDCWESIEKEGSALCCTLVGTQTCFV